MNSTDVSQIIKYTDFKFEMGHITSIVGNFNTSVVSSILIAD